MACSKNWGSLKKDEIFAKASSCYYSYKKKQKHLQFNSFMKLSKHIFTTVNCKLAKQNFSCVFSIYIYIPVLHTLNPNA